MMRWPAVKTVSPNFVRQVAALAGLLLAGMALAAALPPHEVTTPHVKAELVASVGAVVPGSEILLGVRQQIIPHWHTYWRNPGDSGTSTRIDWTLPAGATAGDIEWPAPARITLGPVSNYGYEGEVTLFSRVRVPADLPVGGRFVARATVNWLVCEEECVPEEVELGLSLPVVASTAATGNGSPAIARAQARLPQPLPGKSWLQREADGALRLVLEGREWLAIPDGEVWFYPEQWGRLQQSAAQTLERQGERLTLRLPAGSNALADGAALPGVLVVKDKAGAEVKAYHLAPRLQTAANAEGELGVAAAMLLALLGGIVLNLMPCVFPVLSIKALSLLRHADYSPLQKRLQGLAYTGGVLLSFAGLGLGLILLKAGGQAIGWGFQYQSPVFVLIVAYLMFGVGLNLSGLFSIGSGAVGIGSSLADRAGYSGSFFTGVLATIVATPCTAPFMGAAIGYALSQSAPALLAIFLSLGLGLALPYLLLSAWPRLQSLLPRPGLWMERLKEALAFPMYAAAVWLVWVLAQQAGPNAVLVALGGMLLIALAGWLHGVTRHSVGWRRHGGVGFALLALGLAIVGGSFGVDALALGKPASPAATSAEKPWQPYSAAQLGELRRAGKPVFLNMTAAWCISCLVNERVALSDAGVLAAFKDAGVTYLKGDWTNQDPEISRLLDQFGRSGVPLYVYYPPGSDSQPIVLPQLLTPDIVRSHLSSRPSLSSSLTSKESS